MSSRDNVGSRVGELEGSKGTLCDDVGSRVGESEGSKGSPEGWGNGTDGGSDSDGEGVGSSGKSLLENARRLTWRDCALVRTRQAKRSAGQTTGGHRG